MPSVPDMRPVGGPSPDRPARPRITILLATYNGARHLPEQLASYLAQRGVEWDLWVSDDGSTDGTRALIARFARDHGAGREIRRVDGPRRGAAANFMSLLCHPDLPTSGPVALSDQDDVWHPDKLARAFDALEKAETVSIYSAQCLHTDDRLRVIGRSRPPRRPLGFRNALTQNVLSGHSLAMDSGALALVRRAGMPDGIAYHDWWLYQLLSGAGGQVIVDTARMNRYRQHGSNAMGSHDGLRAKLRRMGQVLGRDYGGWIAANIAALDRVAHLLTSENRAVLAALRAAPPGLIRARILWRQGLYRQTRSASAAFYAAALLGRI